jgi:hypothetical protein
MISIACQIFGLIRYQLHELPLVKGDRPFSSDRHSLGAAVSAGYARAARLAVAGRPAAFPRRGGTPHTQGLAHAHRSTFAQRASRQFEVVILGGFAASDLSALGVGVRASRGGRPLLAQSGVGGKISRIAAGGVRKRTLSDRRPLASVRRSPIDIGGAGALALMRAPALLCGPGCRPAVMGCRP